MKKLMQLKGAQVLNKKEQKSITGGNTGMICYSHSDCDVLSSIPGFEYEEFFCFWGHCQIA
ncbi:hypothetical protein [Aquimarina sp. 2201CG5-10]|uniref:hypothetical protein n=1 Tax=Aquimarina callyspongiae TaxID=3098150 RepID=UPI002AB47FD5|nr:hypothetical protein [Aquimarina sp. 2201CG5-10]MDY8137397.1 hypothetical protein [Aquimarina sp. 2201CG5-10]